MPSTAGRDAAAPDGRGSAGLASSGREDRGPAKSIHQLDDRRAVIRSGADVPQGQVAIAIEDEIAAHLSEIELLWMPDSAPERERDVFPDHPGGATADGPRLPTPALGSSAALDWPATDRDAPGAARTGRHDLPAQTRQRQTRPPRLSISPTCSRNGAPQFEVEVDSARAGAIQGLLPPSPRARTQCGR